MTVMLKGPGRCTVCACTAVLVRAVFVVLNYVDEDAKGSLSDPDCYMNSLWPRISSVQVR